MVDKTALILKNLILNFATGWDGFLHIVPALSLVDPKSVSDQSWNPLDLTSFPAVTTSPPTCCVWWQSTALGHQVQLFIILISQIEST